MSIINVGVLSSLVSIHSSIITFIVPLRYPRTLSRIPAKSKKIFQKSRTVRTEETEDSVSLTDVVDDDKQGNNEES